MSKLRYHPVESYEDRLANVFGKSQQRCTALTLSKLLLSPGPRNASRNPTAFNCTIAFLERVKEESLNINKGDRPCLLVLSQTAVAIAHWAHVFNIYRPLKCTST